jgi:cytochrome-b5 reductase
MAAILTLTSRKALPYLTGFGLASSAALIYTYSRPSAHSLDSAQNSPTKLLGLPRTLLFAQTLTVTKTEQVNHDTKRITFSLPGGENQISGVPAGCESNIISHFMFGKIS